MGGAPQAPITAVRARAYTIPTDAPESDGTISWTSTTIVIAEIEAGGETGLGYTYAHAAAGHLIRSVLSDHLEGEDPDAIAALWSEMAAAVRNIGRPGLAACAISAVDVALWDLKARRLGVALATLLGPARTAVPAYGSGGFTSYALDRIRQQLGRWAEEGCRFVKMKVGRDPDADVERVAAAREAIGAAALFVDGNGAYDVKQALLSAETFAGYDVEWFEEPVSSDNLEGLRLVRDRAPAGMSIAAGEYGYTPDYFKSMLASGAVDVLQADATRCGGVTGFLRAAALAEAFDIPFSAHCAPALHVVPGCAAPGLLHLEWFHDHVRIEAMLFDGAPSLHDGEVRPDLSRPGLGLTLKRQDAEHYEV